MSAAKHTPGPWLLATSNSWRRFVAADGTPVCEPTVYSARDPHPDLHFGNGGADGPDALLIAAAPDMLAALQALSDALPSDEYMREHGQEPGPGIVMMRAAIAKATGGAA